MLTITANVVFPKTLLNVNGVTCLSRGLLGAITHCAILISTSNG